MLAQDVIDGHLAEDYDRSYCCSTHSAPSCHRISPSSNCCGCSQENAGADEAGVEFIYEPSVNELLAEIMLKNIEVQIFKAMLESVAEHGARMTAMDSASKTLPR